MRVLMIAALCAVLTPGWARAQIAGKAVSAATAADQKIATELRRQYAGSSMLRGVVPSVDNQIVTLSGTVPSYRAELEAIHRARQHSGVNGFIDHLTINGPTVADATLRKELSQRLTYDRIGMGQVFNMLTLHVHNGVVTVGGNVYDYPDRDSALDIIADTKGVQGVVDNIKVAPLSPFDNQIRYQVARRIYGNPAFQQYLMNPAHPIRILVSHGNVTLAGVVTSQVDKSLAGSLVRGIPDVFKVTNDLVVAK